VGKDERQLEGWEQVQASKQTNKQTNKKNKFESEKKIQGWSTEIEFGVLKRCMGDKYSSCRIVYNSSIIRAYEG